MSETKNPEDEERELRAAISYYEGEIWSTEKLRAEFDVEGFAAPFVVVRRKSDGQRGTLMFHHAPRVYFDFQPV